MNRRGFIKGLGALLATSSLVKPPAIVVEAVTNAAAPGEVGVVWSTVRLGRLIYFLGGNGTLYSWDAHTVEWREHGNFTFSDFHDGAPEDMLRDM